MQVGQSIHEDNYRVYNEVVAKLKKDLEEERSSKKKVFLIYETGGLMKFIDADFSKEEAQRKLEFLNNLEVSFSINVLIQAGWSEQSAVMTCCIDPYEIVEAEIR